VLGLIVQYASLPLPLGLTAANLSSGLLDKMMKLLLVLAFVAVATLDKVDEFGPCMLSSRGMECYQGFIGCYKEAKGFREHDKCLKHFQTCVAGDCPKKCDAAYTGCQRKLGNLAADKFKCMVDYNKCFLECKQNMHHL